MLCNAHDPSMTPALEEAGWWAQNEIELTRQYAKGIVIDVGANIGTHTLIYAQTADHVFAFEPQPFVFNNLCANLLLNNIVGVTPVMAALSSHSGYSTMRIQDPTVLNSPAGCRLGEGEHRVSMRTLDSLGIAPISFIKIDVEAHEFDVLEGAIETLKRDMPVVYVEIHYKYLIDPIVNLMAAIGYGATPAIITYVQYPDAHAFSPGDMLEVYGYLFKKESIGEA